MIESNDLLFFVWLLYPIPPELGFEWSKIFEGNNINFVTVSPYSTIGQLGKVLDFEEAIVRRSFIVLLKKVFPKSDLDVVATFCRYNAG